MALMILNLVVDCIRRKSTSRLMAFIGLAVSLMLLLVRIPSDCEQCSLAVLQIGLVMVARFCIGFMFGLFFVTQSEFFPGSVKAAGVSSGTFAGLLGTVVSQVALTDAKQLGINPFLIIGVIFVLALVGYEWMPETYQLQPQDQVEEMRDP